MSHNLKYKWKSWNLRKAEQNLFKTIHQYCHALNVEAIEDDVCYLYLRYRKDIKRYPDMIAAALVYTVIKATRPEWTIIDVASRLMISVSDLNTGVQRIKQMTMTANDPVLPEDTSNDGMLIHQVNILIDQSTSKVYSIMWHSSQQDDNNNHIPIIPDHTRQHFKHLTQGIISLAHQNGLVDGRHLKLLLTASMIIAACAMTGSSYCTDNQYEQLANYMGYSKAWLRKRSNEITQMLLGRAQMLLGRYYTKKRSQKPRSISLEVLEEIISNDDNTNAFIAHIQQSKEVNANAPPSFKKSERERKYQDDLIKAARDLEARGNTGSNRDDENNIDPEVKLTAILLEQGVAEDEIRTMKTSDLPLRVLQILRSRPEHDLNDTNLSDKDLTDQEMNEYLVDAFKK
ncbi:hypothetical protein K492DRAFT_207335 [Lichtheimia hyalospora FSU 10163]|nr:hypothetical protein K492DRAFT_207335 [Lichtheimia hyalospora FSU 10163]